MQQLASATSAYLVQNPDLQGKETEYLYSFVRHLARTKDDDNWTDLHGQEDGTVRGTG